MYKTMFEWMVIYSAYILSLRFVILLEMLVNCVIALIDYNCVIHRFY